MTCDTLGLYARSAEDLELLATVFRLQDDKPVLETPFEVGRARIAFLKSPQWKEAGPGTRKAWETAKGLLKAEGAEVEEIKLPVEFGKVMGWADKVLKGEGRSSFLGRECCLSCFEIAAVVMLMLMMAEYLHDKDKLSKYIREIVENASNTSRKELLDAYDGVARLRPVWDDIASRYDAVLTPSVPDEAPVGIDRTGSPVSRATILHCVRTSMLILE